jgi:hypothetical protein
MRFFMKRFKIDFNQVDRDCVEDSYQVRVGNENYRVNISIDGKPVNTMAITDLESKLVEHLDFFARMDLKEEKLPMANYAGLIEFLGRYVADNADSRYKGLELNENGLPKNLSIFVETSC